MEHSGGPQLLARGVQTLRVVFIADWTSHPTAASHLPSPHTGPWEQPEDSKRDPPGPMPLAQGE